MTTTADESLLMSRDSTPRTGVRHLPALTRIEQAPRETPPESPKVLPQAKPSAPRIGFKRYVAVALLGAVAIVGGAYSYRYWQWAAWHESTDNAFIDAHIVQLSSRVQGHVSNVTVQDNQFVNAGDVLVELDPADFQAAMNESSGKLVAARADLVAARSAVQEAQAQVQASEASVAQAKAELASRDAELERASKDLEEYTKARDNAAVSTLEWGKADTAAQTARAAHNAAQKAVAAAEAQVNQARSVAVSREGRVAVAEAQITTAQAALEKARLNLSYTTILATSSGRVTRKSVEAGNYVIPGQPLMAIVAPELWVTANFKETQLAKMAPGQKVDVEVDAYPGVTLHGHVDSIQHGAGARFSLLPPENATGNYVKVVQRVPVKIVLDEIPTDGRTLGPGMSVVPTVELK